MSFKISLIDYGMGNNRSIKNALLHIGNFKVEVTSDLETIKASDCLILPGVGAFPDAIKNLEQRNLIDLLNEEVLEHEKPILGICLGMQLLFSSSEEGGTHSGLNWIPGKVEYMKLDERYRIPHIGWNDLVIKKTTPIFDALGEDKNFYFVHSYAANCDDEYVTATFDYGKEFIAAVEHKNIMGMQFHPEKSQINGLRVLAQFIQWAKGI